MSSRRNAHQKRKKWRSLTHEEHDATGLRLAVGETVILLQPILPSVGFQRGWRESVSKMTVSPMAACAGHGTTSGWSIEFLSCQYIDGVNISKHYYNPKTAGHYRTEMRLSRREMTAGAALGGLWKSSRVTVS